MVVTFFPLMVFLNVLAYELLNSTNGRYIQELGDDLLWTVLSCQMNAIINSLIHLVRIVASNDTIPSYLIAELLKEI